MTSKRITELNEHINGAHSKLIVEGSHPKSSIYGAIDAMWTVMRGEIMKVTSKNKVQIKPGKPVGSGIWWMDIKGYTKSDFEATGYLTMYTNVSKANEAVIQLQLDDPSKGKNERDWKLKFFDDYKVLAKEIGNHINKRLTV